MKSPLPTLILAVIALLSPALAQERHNSLAVNEQLVDDAGPYYFIQYGDSTNAYAKAAPLAEAMGLRLSYSNETKTLTFSGNGVTARMRTTSDVEAGLAKRSGVLEANGTDIDSPMGIIVDGVSYVPIVPIAKAFGCDYAWHGQYRLITVDMPRAPPESSRASTGRQLGSGAGATLAGFRVGAHPGFTRVAVDLGNVSGYEVAVDGDLMLITFAASGAAGELWEQRDDNLRSVYFTTVAGRPTLAVRTRHELTPDGRGFRMGRTDSNTLYVDFAPDLEGPAVARLVDEAAGVDTVIAQASGNAPLPLAALPAEPAPRPVVVLDAGHGGRFPGARNGNWREEEIVLQVALATKSLLEAQGVDVILTRSGNTELASDYRGDLSARAAFATPDRNLFVSIHVNAVDSREPNGIETYFFGQPLEEGLIQRAVQENGGGDESLGQQLTNEALRVANEISGQILRETQLNYSRRLAHAVQDRLVAATGASDRGVRQNVFFVLRNARTPAILVELGFVSNPQEGSKLVTPSYQQLLAEAMASGILEFLHAGGALAAH